MALIVHRAFPPRSTFVVIAISLLVTPLAPSAAQSTRIGTAVPVTGRGNSFGYSEGQITSDPTSPSRLLVCTMRWSADDIRFVVEAHRSIDSGVTWQPVFVSPTRSADPICAWGPDGTSYISTLASPDRTHHRLYKSVDDAATWAEVGVVTGVFDRPFITVDATGGKFHNRIYIVGSTQIHPSNTLNGFSLYRSSDGGRTILGPAQFATSGSGSGLTNTGNVVVSANGSLYIVYSESLPTQDGVAADRLLGATPNARIRVISSRDGGESFGQSQTIAEFVGVRRMQHPDLDVKGMSTFMPQLAVDTTHSRFRDRLYTVWVDAWYGVRFSYSGSEGRNWSLPVTLAESPIDDSGVSLDRPIQPMLAVSRDGVILVAWYDRSHAKGSLSYRIMFRLSYDGGDTFTPVMQVPNAGALFNGREKWLPHPYAATVGHNGGLGSILHFEMLGFSQHLYKGGDYNFITADSKGRFHLYWIDNRDGLPQVWTASVTPAASGGNAVRTLMATLRDVSDMVSVKATKAEYDQATGRAKLSLTFTNTSNQTIRGPLKLRILTADSDFGMPRLEGQDAIQDEGPGIIDVSAAMPAAGVLGPGQSSQPVSLSFIIANRSRLSLRRGSIFGNFVLKGNARLFGLVLK